MGKAQNQAGRVEKTMPPAGKSETVYVPIVTPPSASPVQQTSNPPPFRRILGHGPDSAIHPTWRGISICL